MTSCGEWVEHPERPFICGAMLPDRDDTGEPVWRPAYCPACLRAGEKSA